MSLMSHRLFSSADQFVIGFDSILRSFTHQLTGTGRASPAEKIPEPSLTPTERHHSGGLMRVNYTGEVAAQALYLGQALVAHRYETREALLQAAREEQDHLIWCEQRIKALNTHTSYLNPLWFMGSLAIGITAGLVSDKYSLGFVVETERQVENHLTEHLSQLPAQDKASRAVLLQMREDEIHHGHQAELRGAQELPAPVKWAMKIPAKIMTTLAYYF